MKRSRELIAAVVAVAVMVVDVAAVVVVTVAAAVAVIATTIVKSANPAGNIGHGLHRPTQTELDKLSFRKT